MSDYEWGIVAGVIIAIFAMLSSVAVYVLVSDWRDAIAWKRRRVNLPRMTAMRSQRRV